MIPSIIFEKINILNKIFEIKLTLKEFFSNTIFHSFGIGKIIIFELKKKVIVLKIIALEVFEKDIDGLKFHN